MSNDKMRRQIAFEAARLLSAREETEFHRAKLKVARRLSSGWVNAADLPTNREIQDQLQLLARDHRSPAEADALCTRRLAALRIMKLLKPFRPRLSGGTLSGGGRDEEIDIHVVSGRLQPILDTLDQAGLAHEVHSFQSGRSERARPSTRVRFHADYPVELTFHPAKRVKRVRRAGPVGRQLERASIGDLELLLSDQSHHDADAPLLSAEETLDRFHFYRMLLAPLENVIQDPEYHPEGDALYHSLQVFQLAQDQRPYDEEFLLAALLHDVGKAIEPRNAVAAGLDALGDTITPRTAWLIEQMSEAARLREGTLGVRSRRRLQASPDFDDLVLLDACDRAGRARGVQVPDIEEALEFIRDLAETCGE